MHNAERHSLYSGEIDETLKDALDVQGALDGLLAQRLHGRCAD